MGLNPPHPISAAHRFNLPAPFDKLRITLF